jgi:hypothetical protein
MKIDLLLLFFLYLAHSPFAQSINNNRDNSSGQNNVINRENRNKEIHTIETRKRTELFFSEHISFFQCSQQIQADYQNRLKTNKDLLLLTGFDKMKVEKLLQQLESNLMMFKILKIENSNTKTQLGSDIQNGYTISLFKKVQDMNWQMMMNNAGNSQAINPNNRCRITNSKLAKYETKRELQQEQQGRASGKKAVAIANIVIQKTTYLPYAENLKQQLDAKIREKV